MENKTFDKLGKKLAGLQDFTLVEVLIITTLMGFFAAVAVPNISGFITSGSLAAANTEAQNVKAASLVYYVENTAWPADSTALSPYVTGTFKATYRFDVNGEISSVTGSAWGNLKWSAASQRWISVMDDDEVISAVSVPPAVTAAPAPAPRRACQMIPFR